MTNACRPYEIRLLTDAIRSLTYNEIMAFGMFNSNQKYKDVLSHDFEGSFWSRIENFGLFNGGDVKHTNNTTPLGQKLSKITELAQNT